MPIITNKQRVLTQLFTTLKRRYAPSETDNHLVLEHFLYAVCREGITPAQADRAFRSLAERYFDWNEIRVTSLRELTETLADLPDAEVRAQRLISLLQEVFETTFSFDLEILHKKGLKQAAKQLARFQAAGDYAVAWVVQRALGGHAVPLDPPTLRVLRRLGLIDGDQDDLETLRASLEHLVPKSKSSLFSDLVSALADEFCWEDEPNCPSCPLCSHCPTGQEAARDAVPASRGNRPKPR